MINLHHYLHLPNHIQKLIIEITYHDPASKSEMNIRSQIVAVLTTKILYSFILFDNSFNKSLVHKLTNLKFESSI